MKSLLLCFLTFFFISSIWGQQRDLDFYSVKLTDKGLVKKGVIIPSRCLNEKAVERRLNHRISFDEADIPVEESYVQAISQVGIKILTRSRWFNTILVESTRQDIDKIRRFSFIDKIEQLSKNSQKPEITISKKPKMDLNPMVIPILNTSNQTPGDVYNYGSAFNQINQLNGQYLHNLGFGGQGMTIAVIDAGFNSVDKMSCFDSLRANHQILGTRNFAQPYSSVYSPAIHQHGTMVLSCMAANASGEMVGAAPKANYWLLRTEIAESESIIEEYYWVSAAEFADSVGADLINSSLGYTTFDNGASSHTYTQMDGNTTIITMGADKAAEKGILVVNSAGNSGGGGWWYIGAPADGDSVFTIGSVDAGGNRSAFSSVGPTFDRRIKPTVCAQGSGSTVISPSGIQKASGTSFSSPIICGITACLWQAMPEYNNMEIIETIKATASQANNPDSLLGWGIPDFKAAFSTRSISTLAVEKHLFVYPNPFSEKLTFGFPYPITGKYSIEILDVHGAVVYSRNGNNGVINSIQIEDLSFIPIGIYFVKVTTEQKLFIGKIVKN